MGFCGLVGDEVVVEGGRAWHIYADDRGPAGCELYLAFLVLELFVIVRQLGGVYVPLLVIALPF